MEMIEIRELSAYEEGLAEVLVDCVAGGASVGFMAGFTQVEAVAFFERVFSSVDLGERVLLAGYFDGRLVGTVQIVLAMMPNQPHRGEIAKLLVLRSARGLGVAGKLMEEAERVAAKNEKTLLVLDTANSHAEALYKKLGWVRVGEIPNYALLPNGNPCATTVFWKAINSRP